MKNDLLRLIESVEFAANKHKFQRRKGNLKIPYINHPVKVCKLLADSGESDIETLLAAILHDTLEDTDTGEIELTEHFGNSVANIVIEVTDNMKLHEKERKELQVTKASQLSVQAKKIKIADKICNIDDILTYPLIWSKRRKRKYIEWAKKVCDGCKGQNLILDQKFEEIYRKGMELYSK